MQTEENSVGKLLFELNKFKNLFSLWFGQIRITTEQLIPFRRRKRTSVRGYGRHLIQKQRIQSDVINTGERNNGLKRWHAQCILIVRVGLALNIQHTAYFILCVTGLFA